jgi:hypothetical protein
MSNDVPRRQNDRYGLAAQPLRASPHRRRELGQHERPQRPPRVRRAPRRRTSACAPSRATPFDGPGATRSGRARSASASLATASAIGSSGTDHVSHHGVGPDEGRARRCRRPTSTSPAATSSGSLMCQHPLSGRLGSADRVLVCTREPLPDAFGEPVAADRECGAPQRRARLSEVPYRRRRRSWWCRSFSSGSSRAEPPPAREWRSRRRRVRAKRRVLCNASRRSARAATSSKHQKNTASANHPSTTYNHQPNVRAGYS